MPAPRPILKGLPRSSSVLSPEVAAEGTSASNPFPFAYSTTLDTPHVHFPPTPTLTSTVITHSSFIYDRAPIVVTPNVCALPERGGRSFIGSNSNSNQGGLGYFHPHAKFQVDVSSETVSPAIFSASVTVGPVNDCGSVGLFRKKRSGPIYDYDNDQHTQHTQHVISSFIFDTSPGSSDLGSPRASFLSTSTPSSSPLSIPHQTLSISPRNMYDPSTAPPSPTSTTTGHHHNHNTASHSDQYDQKKRSPVDISGKKRRKSRENECYNTHNQAEGESRSRDDWTRWTMVRAVDDSDGTARELELEGCLGGF